MKRELEALLFATDSPLTINRLKKLFPGTEAAELKTELQGLEADYEATGHAFTLVEFGGGWQISTRPEFSPVVEKMLKGRRFTRLSKAGLEVLAIIAYRQPITRLEVDEIRGVNSSGAISTLTERNLITVVGRSQTVGNPLLYGTTREFLNYLGLKGLGQLPDLPDLEAVMEDRNDLKEFASMVGRDVSDEEIEDYFAAPETVDHPQAEGETPATDPTAAEEEEEEEVDGGEEDEAAAAETDDDPTDDPAAIEDEPDEDFETLREYGED